ncbi:GAF domain-containing protein [Streptomyces sp. SID1121]|uniref:GAF domain-containing protein n=1 Tax=Streptomyces sp. SID1121 TaxID=3425888 RepID=UPI004055A86F
MEKPDPVFDRIAADLAEEAGVPYGFVNLINDRRQFFVGLRTADGRGDDPAVGRTMRMDQGFCPGLLDPRREGRSLVLGDVRSAPRFSGNPVVDSVGILTYAGAPLVHPETGIPIGSVCFVGREPRGPHLNQISLSLVKDYRQKVWRAIEQGAGRGTR